MINLADLPQEMIDRLNVLDLQALTTFQFALQIDGHPKGSQFYLGFSRVVGIKDNVEMREVLEGGSRHVQRFPRRSLTPAVQIEKGLTYSRFMWQWYQDVVHWTKGKPNYTKNVSVYMLSNIAVHNQLVPFEVWHWEISNAWPSEWKGPQLDANTEKIAFEQITLQHNGIKQAEGIFSGKVGELSSILI